MSKQKHLIEFLKRKFDENKQCEDRAESSEAGPSGFGVVSPSRPTTNENSKRTKRAVNRMEDLPMAGTPLIRSVPVYQAPVHINVGGTVYTSSLETLTRFPNSKLAKYFNGTLPITVDPKNQTYFLDRDGKIFRHILNYLRNSKLILPDNYSELKLLLEEAYYFEIEDLKTDIEQFLNIKNESPANVDNIQQFLSINNETPMNIDGSFSDKGTNTDSINEESEYNFNNKESEHNAIMEEYESDSSSEECENDSNNERTESYSPYEVVDNFDDMNLKRELLRRIYDYGFECPTAIQQQAIIPCVQGHDVIMECRPGTGKTVTYVISILQRIVTYTQECQALIVVPTQDLCLQIKKLVDALSDPMLVKCYACIRGTNLSEEKSVLEKGVHVVVGTPYEVFRLMNSGIMNTSCIKILVVDEIDELLLNWWVLDNDIDEVSEILNGELQVILVSPPYSSEVHNLNKTLMKNPINILDKKEPTLEGIKHFYVLVGKEDWKLDILRDLCNTLRNRQAVIFCNMKTKVDWLAKNMQKQDLFVFALHGTKKQTNQDFSLRQNLDKSGKFVVTTGLMAQSRDVQQFSVIINYDLPSVENYLHRVYGDGRKRVVINFLREEETSYSNEIGKFYNTTMTEMSLDISADLICSN